jgi:hypothetical protein
VRENRNINLGHIITIIAGALAVVAILFGIGVSWGSLQSTLASNRDILLNTNQKIVDLSNKIETFRQHQIVNEDLIDMQGQDIDELKRFVKLPSGRFDRKASGGPKK